MEWTEDALVLASRRHGETSTITTVLSPAHGRYAGLVRGGVSKTRSGTLQPGNLVRARWRARLPEHLGTLGCELITPYAAMVLDAPLKLSALMSACAVTDSVLPEREAHASVYHGLLVLLRTLDDDETWPSVYVKWELGLLGELGFGLDLSACAATGSNDDLIYVSPKSGRAVSAVAGEPYKDRMLALPAFLIGGRSHDRWPDAADGVRLTGHFLRTTVYEEHGLRQPEARTRFVQALKKRAAVTSLTP